jgi:hypothetical protein
LPIPQGLKFDPQRLFALPQVGHTAAQFVERQQVFLIGGQKTVHAFAGSNQLAIQFGLAPFSRTVGPCRSKAAIDLLLDQGGVFQQVQHFGPNQAVQQILADWSIVAGRSRKVTVTVSSQAAVIVDPTRG